jgi:hypothetical protein
LLGFVAFLTMMFPLAKASTFHDRWMRRTASRYCRKAVVPAMISVGTRRKIKVEGTEKIPIISHLKCGPSNVVFYNTASEPEWRKRTELSGFLVTASRSA